MRLIIGLSGLLLGAGLIAGAATPSFADTTTSTSGGGASVSIVSGSNGGTTIIVDSRHRCRTENAGTTASGSSASPSGSISSSVGAGGLSGSATAGAGGTSVNIGPGGHSSSMTSSSSGKNVAAANECVVIIRAPTK